MIIETYEEVIIEAYGHIENNQLFITNRQRFNDDVALFGDADVVIMVKSRGQRSTAQNRYYWGIVVKEIVIRLKELGNDVNADMVHEYLKGRFNLIKVITTEAKDGKAKAIDMAVSTTELNKEEFGEYLRKIKMWASEILAINIPDAGSQGIIDFQDDKV